MALRKKKPGTDRNAERQARADALAEAIRRGDLTGAADLLQKQTREKSLGGPAASPRTVGSGERFSADPDASRADASPAPPNDGTIARAHAIAMPAGLGGCDVSVRTFEAQASVYQVRTPLADTSGGAALAAQLDGVLGGARQRFDELDASPGLCHAADAAAHEVLLARPVACALHGKDDQVMALLGLLYRGPDGWLVEQSLARTPEEEAGVMLAFAVRRDAAKVLATYPAQSSQLKLLRTRCDACGTEVPDRWPAHLDLRKEARRVWQRRLPNYKLPTLTHMLLARPAGPALSANQTRRALRRLLLLGDASAAPRVLDQSRRELADLARLLCLLLTGTDPLP